MAFFFRNKSKTLNSSNQMDLNFQDCLAGPYGAVWSMSDSRGRGAGSIPTLATYFLFPLCLFKKNSCQLYGKVYMHLLVVYHKGGLSLPRNSAVRLTYCPDMTIAAVYRRCKATNQ